MHEAALARAALPAPTVCLGMLLQPYSLGHELWLIRENNSALRYADEGLPAAVLICSQTWDELRGMRGDHLLRLKLWLWKRRVSRLASRISTPGLQTPDAKPYLESELSKFHAYRDEGTLEFMLSQITRPDRGSPSRMPGAPFILRLQQWLMTALGLSEAEAWDYPVGLAKMRWTCHWEQESGLDIYNAHDAEFDAFVAEQEAKKKEAK